MANIFQTIGENITQFLEPTQDVRIRDVLREIPETVSKFLKPTPLEEREAIRKKGGLGKVLLTVEEFGEAIQPLPIIGGVGLGISKAAKAGKGVQKGIAKLEPLAKELESLAQEARKLSESEFVSNNIFEKSIVGAEKIAIEKLPGKSFSDKLSYFYNQAVKGITPKDISTGGVIDKLQKTLSRSQVNALREFGINEKTTRKEAAEILGDITGWKDRNTTFFRFFQTLDDKITSTAGKDADKVKNILTRPRGEAVTKMFKEEFVLKREMKDTLNRLKVNNTKDRALIMRFGEKRISLEELKKVRSKNWNNIIEAEKWFRGKYDKLLEETNNVLRQFYKEDKLIPKRENYYTHFWEINSLWQAVTGKGGDINPVLEGISEFTRPNRRFNPFGLRRKGALGFKEDAGKAFEAYLPAILNNKYLSESIVRHKAVADILAHNTIDSRNVNAFVRSLREHSRNLANKTNPFDRALMENVTGRLFLRLLNASVRRLAANRIVGSVSSAIMQISGIPTSVLENGIIRTTKGVLSQALSPLMRNDPLQKSKFLVRRYGEGGLKPGETIFKTITQRGADFVMIPFEVIEKNITKGIWRASFDNAWGQGYRGEALMIKTDEITESLVGGRAIGEKALAFESSILSLPLQFQLEVNAHAMAWKRNVFDNIFKNPVKATSAAIETSITLFLFNTLFQETLGRTPLPDPIRAVSEAAEAEGFTNKVGRIVGEGLSSVAGGQFIASLLPQDIRKKFFGRSEVGIYPGGIPVVNAIGGNLRKLITKKDASGFVYDFALPYGGAQLKRIIEGLEAVTKQGSFNSKGQLQFPINQNEWLKILIFGKYSTKEAKEFFDKQDRPLTEKQTVEYFLRTRKGENAQKVYLDITKERRQSRLEKLVVEELIKKLKSNAKEGLAILQLWKSQGIVNEKMEKEILNGLKK